MPLKALQAPLYAQIVATLQDRITAGVYGAGEVIPSEPSLQAEFGASRPTVVRALGVLQQDGWIVAEKGRGRFVRRSHAIDPHQGAGAGRAALGIEKMTGVRMLTVGPVPAPTRAAVALHLGEGEPVWARTRLVTAAREPVQLVTVYTSVDLAEGTQLARPAALTVDPLAHLAAVKGVRFDYATDRISARTPTPDEARLLDLDRRDIVLTILAIAYDTTGEPRVAADATIPAARMDLEDTFPLG
jgi:GntR family transcriptional regulator